MSMDGQRLSAGALALGLGVAAGGVVFLAGHPGVLWWLVLILVGLGLLLAVLVVGSWALMAWRFRDR